MPLVGKHGTGDYYAAVMGKLGGSKRSVGAPQSTGAASTDIATTPTDAPRGPPVPVAAPVTGKHGTGDYYEAVSRKLGGSKRSMGSHRSSDGAAASGEVAPPAAGAAPVNSAYQAPAPASAPVQGTSAAVAESKDPAKKLFDPESSEPQGPDPNYKESWFQRVFNPPHMQSVRRIRLYGKPELHRRSGAQSDVVPPRSTSMLDSVVNPPHLESARSQRLGLPPPPPGSSGGLVQKLTDPRHLASARSQRLSGRGLTAPMSAGVVD